MKDELTTVYLLGDSITQGLGSKKINFTNELARLLGSNYEIVNLAQTGTTIDYAFKIIDEGKIASGGGSVCIVLYGNVDAQIRPSRTGKIFSHIPKRFQGGGMLMPRPFYSRRLVKRAGQHFDNAARRLFSALIKAVDGTEQWVSLEAFDKQYGDLLERLEGMGIEPVACSCVYIDERLFPETPAQYLMFNESIHAHAVHRMIPYVDMWSLLEASVEQMGWDEIYNKDHFHPNGAGYVLMARAIADALVSKSL